MRDITITATMDEGVALQLAQFCKRLQFDHFLILTEAHLEKEERERRSYEMRSGIDAVQAALIQAGFAPR